MKRAGILFVLAGLGPCPALASASDCQVTMAQYEQLRTGMSIAEVVAILGCNGAEMMSKETDAILLLWDGTQRGANLAAMFQDGKLVQKIQSGLK